MRIVEKNQYTILSMSYIDEKTRAQSDQEKKFLLRNEEAKDFNLVASTHEGRRLLRRIIEECGVYSNTFSSDPLITAYNLGKRSIGLIILEQLMDSPILFLKYLTEVNNGNNSNINRTE